MAKPSKGPKDKRNRVLINGIWYWRFSFKGKQFLGRTKNEAWAKREAYRLSNRLTYDKSFNELVDWYIDNIYMKDKTLRESTKTLHLNSFYNVFNGNNLLKERINNINGVDLQAVLSSSDTAGTTQRHCRSFLRRFYKYAVSNGLVSNDATQTLIVEDAEHRQSDQTIETFSSEELKRFLECTPKEHRLRLLIILAIYTGARIGELLALTYEDIENDVIRINKSLHEIQPIKGQKTQKTRLVVGETKTRTSIRTIPIEHQIVKDAITIHKKWHLEEMMKNGYRTNNVFTTQTGELCYISSIRTAFKRLCKQVNVKPRKFHTFRNTFGSFLASNGVPITQVSKLMGHDSIAVTAKYYVNVADAEKREALKKMIL